MAPLLQSTGISVSSINTEQHSVCDVSIQYVSNVSILFFVTQVWTQRRCVYWPSAATHRSAQGLQNSPGLYFFISLNVCMCVFFLCVSSFLDVSCC